MFTLTGARVVDADGVREANVVVAESTGRIESVGDEVEGETRDVTGLVVAPGLVDAHVHLMMDSRADVATYQQESVERACYRAASNLRKTLEAGVTTVRDLGAPGELATSAKAAVASGELEGPRVLAAGENIVMTGGHGHWFGREADGPDEVRKAAREQLKRGADVVKCMATGGVLTEGAVTGAPELTEAEIRALVDAASAKGVPTAAHAHGESGIKNAARAGITSIEHGMFMDKEAADLLVERGTYWVPTASAAHEIVEHGIEAGIPAAAVAKAEDAAERFEVAWDHALDAGVKIAMGTDAGTPFNEHGENALREMELLVEYGLSPEAALEAATVGGAELLGLNDVGKVAEGYIADLVVLEDDPSVNPSAWRTVQQVYREGKQVV
ncbi:amidohydrolase family protein [Haloferax mediterranei ATCC 33500]|uniref:Amidohydrolase n=1 Tax=Haloferax mediterranei (strain ATCC 33500 / DSM 1411 / JCM 8866 / NBRC 14739 / NCIMB 2177 / R-4) TaxID=523841 RepID=I3R8N0_HALMT|nr:amidohydrolase family protein [Haloferax mediterranei]AFK20590.2 amidohydrolase, imidazolonepropionase [Haloferax mediterranei ATCC 33500]ELZ98372.1 amidohydrolase [Haloferax mediterranei ATCC 33500]MDX5986655.1 amidohydrolase family protein [Haloferax mediterranei ATCC 33500]QCQ75987.1 amidohydrolase family protein [Haloferax mediterranei ATCC 33500]